jgi:Dolichyl-phosphate-mannose-protein mannosyltransferase
VTALALTVFGWDLASEPHFVDESAYISQSFYADLWLQHKWDDPLWLHYAGYDLPPLPKYVIGLALRLEGYGRPGPAAMVAWYRDTSRQFVSRDALVAARRPSVVFGAIGCLAIYALGTLALDRRLGLLSALLLMANPLYAMHARRAMSDVTSESLLLATLAVGLWAWKRLLADQGSRVVSVVGLVLGSGVLGGLATLAKLNGSLAGMVLAAWAVLSILLASPLWRSRAIILATIAAGAISFGTFVALNPFLFAHPKGPIDPSLEPLAEMSFRVRVKVITSHRVDVSLLAKSLFPNDALKTVPDKLKAVAVQGFGRFGPFGPRGWTDSTIRFDWKQDWGALVWLPWVAIGFVLAILRGRSQFRTGQPPTAWAIVVQASLALAVVTAFIPLAWDRYFLSIQPGSALLASFAVIDIHDRIRSLFERKPLTEWSA